ncbi:ribonuclease P protein component [Pseudomaricurvus alkylphenolicus]|uniref:ribonuclease P protein component n=1 Tax=Pseudomaricurvus alkylphenolicus TaxID=1306991 RepID=UPI001422B23C|nr:ribonuclease P protein component [Pseudomaricurvus alkylphenolicus]
MPSKTFPKSLRLLNASDFQSVFDDAPVRAPHPQVLILSRPNEKSYPRLGLVIAKKNIRLAVQRNRIKRILRETFRQHQDQLGGLDAIVLARRGLDELSNPELHKLLNKQWQRIIKKCAKKPAADKNQA